MKKYKESFSDAARRIERKYSRAKFDKLEQEGLEREMEMLMQEQENARAQLGLNEQPQQQVQQFGLGGPEDPEVQDINNPNQKKKKKIYQDNRGWMERGLGKDARIGSIVGRLWWCAVDLRRFAPQLNEKSWNDYIS